MDSAPPRRDLESTGSGDGTPHFRSDAGEADTGVVSFGVPDMPGFLRHITEENAQSFARDASTSSLDEAPSPTSSTPPKLPVIPAGMVLALSGPVTAAGKLVDDSAPTSDERPSALTVGFRAPVLGAAAVAPAKEVRVGGHGLDPRLGVASHRWLTKTRPVRELDESFLLHTMDMKGAGASKYWALLMTTAILASTLSFLVDQATWAMGALRVRLMTQISGGRPAVIAINCAILVVARLLVRTTPEAEGSGIPEMKSMLFGQKLRTFLTLRVLAVKTMGLTLVVGAGLPIGKEGPFAHLASCIVANLDSSFHTLAPGAVSQLLLASCSVGVGTTFSSPIGGVIFALELMLPQVYDLITYWGCFASSVLGAVCYATLRASTAGSTGLLPIISTDVTSSNGVASRHPLLRLGVDVLLGVICGLLGGLFIKLHSRLSKAMKAWRMKGQAAPSSPSRRNVQGAGGRMQWSETPLLGHSHPDKPKSWAVDHPELAKSGSRQMRGPSALQSWWHNFQSRDLLQMILAAALNTWLSESLPLLQGKPQPLLMSLLFKKDLEYNTDSWAVPALGPAATMWCSLLMKWFMTILALSLPCPTGVVAPTMVIGALIGRAYSYLIPEFIVEFVCQRDAGAEVTDEMRGAFAARLAIVGASAFCSSVTRAFAMAITVFEVLALPDSVLNLSCASLTAIFVANEIGPGFFDQILLNKGNAGIPALASTRRAMMPVSRVMRRVDIHAECLSNRASLQDIQRLLQNTKEAEVKMFPIVHHLKGGVDALLMGTISRDSLVQIQQQRQTWEDDLVIDFLDPMQFTQADSQLVNRMPLHVTPQTPVKDVYLLLKVMWSEDIVFVTHHGRLLGHITAEELLGKTT